MENCPKCGCDLLEEKNENNEEESEEKNPLAFKSDVLSSIMDLLNKDTNKSEEKEEKGMSRIDIIIANKKKKKKKNEEDEEY